MTPRPHRLRTATAAVAILAAAALAGPPTVSAATITTFNAKTKTITINGDATPERITISDAGGPLEQSVDGGAAENLLDDQAQPQPLPAATNLESRSFTVREPAAVLPEASRVRVSARAEGEQPLASLRTPSGGLTPR